MSRREFGTLTFGLSPTSTVIVALPIKSCRNLDGYAGSNFDKFRTTRNRLKLASAMVAAAVLVAAARIPVGTSLVARLTTPVSSNASKVNDLVQAVIVSPIAAGHILNGRINAVRPANGNENAYLEIEFEGAQLIEVDNARESVDESGRIMGISASHSPEAQIDRGIEKLNERYGKIAEVLETFKTILVRDVNPEIEYPAGVEIRVKLTRSLPVEPVQDGYGIAKRTDPILEDLVRQQPVRAQAQRPALPSDWTNVVFIGTHENIANAFKAAGWSLAAEMNTASVLEAARAIIEARGYQETPVSKLRLDGRLPDMVFQKMNNTLAKRHHLRIWRTQGKWCGQEVWVGAATHDNGIAFAPDQRAFFHTIEPDIDREREKVADDLMFTGLAKYITSISRPGIPSESTNATGDRMITDGKITVLSIGL
jgi:hypothetical protein